MNDKEICDALGWPRRAAEVLAADSEGLLPRIRAVVREAERREREACAKQLAALGNDHCAAAIRARDGK